MRRRRVAYATVAAACVLPRLVVLLHERGSILGSFTEKSDAFARTFVSTGTFGLVPGHPSAYTQPLYGFFLSAIYWTAGRHWLAGGLAPAAALLAATALVVVPWVVRNGVAVGCYTLTTDSRALWKANNANTYATLSYGGRWIDDVPPLPGAPPSPEQAAQAHLVNGT